LSLIRSSNQLVPKNRVVDLIVLYNFYFGQISSAHMKFGVLGCQTLVKSMQMNSSRLLCSRRRTRADGNSTGNATRWTSANLARCARVPVLIPLPEPCPFSPPFLLPRAARSRAARASPPSAATTILATPARFSAPQASGPRPEGPLCLHELVRANPRTNQRLRHRPPSLSPSKLRPRHRRPPPGPPPFDSRPR
jgi:hypothetical protein